MSVINELGDKDARLPYSQVYEWASKNRTESKPAEKYKWTPETKSLLRILRHFNGQLIAVIGLQGIGKTALRNQLSLELGQSAISVKWTDANEMEYLIDKLMNSKEKLWKTLDYEGKLYYEFNRVIEGWKYPSNSEEYYEKVKQALNFSFDEVKYKEFIELLKKEIYETHTRLRENKRLTTFQRIQYIKSNIEEFLGEEKVSDIKKGVYEEEKLNILIDFTDYNITSKNAMNRDFKNFQKIWEYLTYDEYKGYDQKSNFVLFFQQEMWSKGNHFFYGKCNPRMLKPFTPEELTDYYVDKFNGEEPFTREALLLIGSQARGIFRWFMKYIAECIEKYWYLVEEDPSNNIVLGVDKVKQWITMDMLSEDWERELENVFPNSKDYRTKAIQVITHLRENGETLQTELTKMFFEGKSHRCSRCLSALELHGYIRSEYVGRGKMVYLA